ncbi:unnamed protein product [Rhizophagus irregularis]|nr:unnamed protein product [Rhizophagus irregularis]
MIQGFIQIGRLPTFNEYRTEPLEPSDSLLTVKLCYRKRPNRNYFSSSYEYKIFNTVDGCTCSNILRFR